MAHAKSNHNTWRSFYMKLLCLGIGQDEGVPSLGTQRYHGGDKCRPIECLATCLAFFDEESGERFLVEATPDFRAQMRRLHHLTDSEETSLIRRDLAGIFVTHAHIGHYAGLMFLGKESIDVHPPGVPVYCLPKMADFLRTNGPWSQLVTRRNIELREMRRNESVELIKDRLSVEAIEIPHRQEYAETAAFIFTVKSKDRILFLPDLDRYEEMSSVTGESIEKLIARVDLAFIDATFFSSDELGGRDMTQIPHPTITSSLERFKSLPQEERKKIHFIHFNLSNPALDEESKERKKIYDAGMNMAQEMNVIEF